GVKRCAAPGSARSRKVDGAVPTLPPDLVRLSTEAAAGRPEHKDPRIELLAATARGAPNVASLSVVKVERQGVKELDDVYVAMHLAQAQRLIYGGEPSQVPAAKARLQSLLDTSLKGTPLEVHDFQTLNPYYGQAVGLFAAIFGFISILIGAIVLFTVGNTMSMAVVER